MSALNTITGRRPLRAAIWLLVALAIAFVATVAVLPAAAGIAALLVAAAASLVGVLATRPAPRRSAVADVGAYHGPTLRLTLAGGAELSARAVPLAGLGDHQLLLTRDGYILVDAVGRVVHRL